MADIRRILSKEQWSKLEIDYRTGNFKSIAELAQRYGIKENTLVVNIIRRGWKEEVEKASHELSLKVTKTVINEGELYLKRSIKRVERYEKIIDVSHENLGSKNSEGIPVLDPEAINDYTLAETRLHSWGKSCYMIPDASRSLDITSKGQSLGESLVSALAKVRASGEPSRITSEDVTRIIEADIVEE